ncbi:MAG: hypothetical protein U5L11_05950 [Arhodomonas sp.]|nr:hypothetical protein [Arhodomonas sp.]
MMVARLEGALIALELLVYVVAGATAIAGGAGLGLVVITLVGVALGGRAAYVITAFVLARHRDPSAPQLAAGPSVLALAGEWLALTLTHGPLQAIVYPLLRRHLRCPGDRQAPLVILVHGYCCNGGYWLPAWWRLRRRGVAVLPPRPWNPPSGALMSRPTRCMPYSPKRCSATPIAHSCWLATAWGADHPRLPPSPRTTRHHPVRPHACDPLIAGPRRPARHGAAMAGSYARAVIGFGHWRPTAHSPANSPRWRHARTS